jgi:hypothetical protein
MAAIATQKDADEDLLRLVNRVADIHGAEITELPPIHDAIDGDVLSDLLGSEFDGELTFTYAGCEVVVAGDGSVRVRERATLAR